MERLRQKKLEIISLDNLNLIEWQKVQLQKMPLPVLELQLSVSSLVMMEVVNGWLSIKGSGPPSMR